MEHVARLGMLITHDGAAGSRAARWLRPARLEPAGDGAVANSTLLADLAIGLAATPLRDHLNLDGRRRAWGRISDVTSDRPVRLPPPRGNAATICRRFVRRRRWLGQLLQAATHRRACGEQVGPRPCGVNRAFLWMFIRGLGGLYGWCLQFPGRHPEEQPTERSQLASGPTTCRGKPPDPQDQGRHRLGQLPQPPRSGGALRRLQAVGLRREMGRTVLDAFLEQKSVFMAV